MSRPRVLIMPSWYPTAALPLTGSFFKEQAQVVAREWDTRVLLPVAQTSRKYWGNKPLPPDQLPLQDPPAFAARYRTDKWMSWSRRNDSITGALLQSLGEFARDGWIPDVVFAHSAAWAGMLATRVGKRVGLPVVIVEHSSSWIVNEYTAEQESCIRQALADATTVCAVSPALRRLMLAHDLPDTIHWEVVGNLVDESLFCPCESPRTDSEGGFSILTVSARHFIKDVRTLFRAAAIIRTRRPQFHLAIRAVGDFRPGGPTFSELAAECGIHDLVTADYFLERTDTAQAMREADLFVSSSIAETFGIVIAEALACGVPVVATRSGGAEYILGEDSPFLLEPRDPDALAEKILEVVDGRLPFNSERAVHSVVSRFGTQAFGARMREVLVETIERYDVARATARRPSCI